jgi:hypothetical protein
MWHHLAVKERPVRVEKLSEDGKVSELELFFDLTFVVAIGVFTVVKNQGWLTAFGIESSSRDSQVIHAIERTQSARHPEREQEYRHVSFEAFGDSHQRDRLWRLKFADSS